MTTPYYQSGGITIYHGDCREILPGLPAASLLLSDPPYGINHKGGKGGKSIHSKGGSARKSIRIIGDDKPFDPAPLLRFEHVALFGAQHYAARLPDTGSFHCWDKRGDYKPVSFADFDLVWVNAKKAGRIHRCVWRGLCREVENRRRIEHPTQKPERVVRWVADMFPGGLDIIDPYMGSGTTLRVAKDLGRSAIGIELDEHYCEVAAKRLEQEAAA